MKRILFILAIPWLHDYVACPAAADSQKLITAYRQYKELYDVGRYSEAEILVRKALEIAAIELGTEHATYATLLNDLATLYLELGRHTDAELLLRQSLDIGEKASGPDSPDVATVLNNLAQVYKRQGRFGELEALHKRALAIWQKHLGSNHPNVAKVLDNLALVYLSRGRYREAAALHNRALAIFEKTLGPDSFETSTTLNNLAFLHLYQGRHHEAKRLFERALVIREKTFGRNHPKVAITLNNLALVYRGQGRLGEAAALHLRALEISERTLGPNHPQTALSASHLATLYMNQGRPDLSLEYARRASAIHRNRLASIGIAQSIGDIIEHRNLEKDFLQHLLAAHEAPAADDSTRRALIGEAFEAGQLANSSEVAIAVSRVSVRLASGDDMLSNLVRDRQDGSRLWQRLDRALVEAASRPPGQRDQESESIMRRQLSALSEKMELIDERLRTEFPQYAELSSPKAVPLAEAQALLAKDEALLTYLVWENQSFVFALRQDQVQAGPLSLRSDELDEAVALLRSGLNPKFVRSPVDLPPFDTEKAYWLYQKLIRPVEPLLADARHVVVVPDGAIASLPLNMLVTEANHDEVTRFSDYKRMRWLARKYAVTTVPSVSALKALRTLTGRSKATRPFLGIGDPELASEAGSERGIELGSLFAARGIANVEAVRKLASLPETAGELRSLAQMLGASESDLLLGIDATETRVKHAQLAEYKVLAFATHGLVAGELSDQSEPSLVLTPPEIGSKEDDGLLTASEIALLKLDADLVILSACNTAAADGRPGAQGLSRLATAFFYAGSRALLVSHWPVASRAAVRLTTGMLAQAAAYPEIRLAETLRRSMMALLSAPNHSHFAHPIFWAPLVVVGEGGVSAPAAKEGIAILLVVLEDETGKKTIHQASVKALDCGYKLAAAEPGITFKLYEPNSTGSVVASGKLVEMLCIYPNGKSFGLEGEVQLQ